LKIEGVKEVEMGLGDERDGGFVRELREVQDDE
jgi:hypothetical protein